jgi:hypothetical protein
MIALLALLLIRYQPGDMILNSFPMPGKLIPTLIVWTVATILIEFAPRRGPATLDQ